MPAAAFGSEDQRVDRLPLNVGIEKFALARNRCPSMSSRTGVSVGANSVRRFGSAGEADSPQTPALRGNWLLSQFGGKRDLALAEPAEARRNMNRKPDVPALERCCQVIQPVT